MSAPNLQPIPYPEAAKEKHTEMFMVDGVAWPANTCRRCNKWFPPYMVGVPVEREDEYCWGHEHDDIKAERDAALAAAAEAKHLAANYEAGLRAHVEAELAAKADAAEGRRLVNEWAEKWRGVPSADPGWDALVQWARKP